MDAEPEQPAPPGEAPRVSARSRAVRDVALTLFAERGYHGTTMNDIARALGIRAPSLYNHLRSKQDLLREVIVETSEQVLADFHAAVAEAESVSDQLRRAVEAYVRRHATHRREALIVNRDLRSVEDPAGSEVRSRLREHEHAVRELIERGRAAGEFEVESPSIASFTILEMSVGVARWFRDDGRLTPDDVARMYGDFALRIVGSRASGA